MENTNTTTLRSAIADAGASMKMLSDAEHAPAFGEPDCPDCGSQLCDGSVCDTAPKGLYEPQPHANRRGNKRPATEKQLAFIDSLREERDFASLGDRGQELLETRDVNLLTTVIASELIDILKTTALASTVSSDGFTRDRQSPETPRRFEPSDDAETLDLTDLPSGLYGVPVDEVDSGGDTRLKIRVNRPKSGKWVGWTFVDDGAEYGQRRKYGSQRPDEAYRGQIVDQLRAIVDDVAGARARYGALTGRCSSCNRTLEDETSVALGIGPVCRGDASSG